MERRDRKAPEKGIDEEALRFGRPNWPTLKLGRQDQLVPAMHAAQDADQIAGRVCVDGHGGNSSGRTLRSQRDTPTVEALAALHATTSRAGPGGRDVEPTPRSDHGHTADGAVRTDPSTRAAGYRRYRDHPGCPDAERRHTVEQPAPYSDAQTRARGEPGQDPVVKLPMGNPRGERVREAPRLRRWS